MAVFKDMVDELQNGRENPDGADQGFIASYFPELLDKPMFYPPSNGTRLDGTYRLPLGYQMDASYYCKYVNKKERLSFSFWNFTAENLMHANTISYFFRS